MSMRIYLQYAHGTCTAVEINCNTLLSLCCFSCIPKFAGRLWTEILRFLYLFTSTFKPVVPCLYFGFLWNQYNFGYLSRIFSLVQTHVEWDVKENLWLYCRGQTRLALVTIILALTLGTYGMRFVHNSPPEVLKSRCDLTQRVKLGHLELELQSGIKVPPSPPITFSEILRINFKTCICVIYLWLSFRLPILLALIHGSFLFPT